jgi:hypothetical protein
MYEHGCLTLLCTDVCKEDCGERDDDSITRHTKLNKALEFVVSNMLMMMARNFVSYQKQNTTAGERDNKNNSVHGECAGDVYSHARAVPLGVPEMKNPGEILNLNGRWPGLCAHVIFQVFLTPVTEDRTMKSQNMAMQKKTDVE